MTIDRYSSRTKRAQELALREALSMGHSRIDPEHLLLGLLQLDDGPVNAAFNPATISHEDMRNSVIREMQRKPPTIEERLTAVEEALRAGGFDHTGPLPSA